MKKILIAFVLVTMLFTLCGCDSLPTTDLVLGESFTNGDINNEITTATETEPFEMEHIGVSSDYGFDYYRDIVTDVIYVLHHFEHRGGYTGAGGSGLTVMLDPGTGLPLTYTRYMEIYNNLEVKE